jgi:hypothetical protein
MRVSVKFVKQDCWIGVYWKSSWSVVGYLRDRADYDKFTKDGRWGRDVLKVYVCIIPCFPIIFERRAR